MVPAVAKSDFYRVFKHYLSHVLKLSPEQYPHLMFSQEGQRDELWFVSSASPKVLSAFFAWLEYQNSFYVVGFLGNWHTKKYEFLSGWSSFYVRYPSGVPTALGMTK